MPNNFSIEIEGGIEEPPMVGRNIGVIMKLGVLKEPADETRVAIVPTSMKKLLKAGFEVIIEAGAGRLANYSDQAYTDAGATIGTREEALACANIITIRFPGVAGTCSKVPHWPAFLILSEIRNTSKRAWTLESPSSQWT